MTKILVTGANGFVGRALVNRLIQLGIRVTASVRHSSMPKYEDVNEVIHNINSKTDWKSDLVGIDVVIHLAARVHVMNDSELDPLSAFREINTSGTMNLARQASKAGVKRFIFMSSIKVNGESTGSDWKFKADDKANPTDPYATSKFEAEQELLALVEKVDMDVVIIRPPLVYGLGVKANFALMMRWVYKSIPLPLGAINNQRSLIALDNLVDFIVHCVSHPKAANETFLVSDGEDVTTTQLIEKIAGSLQKKAWLVPIPGGLIRYFARLVGKGDQIDRLLGNLQLDNSKAKELLDWNPVVTMDEQLTKMAVEFDK